MGDADFRPPQGRQACGGGGRLRMKGLKTGLGGLTRAPSPSHIPVHPPAQRAQSGAATPGGTVTAPSLGGWVARGRDTTPPGG